MGKKKKQVGETSEDGGSSSKVEDNKSPNSYDNDTMAFISMSQELKYEGNKMFQKRDLQGALMKYEKALKLLPRNHVDVSYLRSNMAACYMQMGPNEYPRAIQECNLALEVTPRYSKALLKRARCYEALNRLDLALMDVGTVVTAEPDNVTALEMAEKVKNALEGKGLRVNGTKIELPPDYVEPPNAVPAQNVAKDKTRKKKNNKQEEKAPEIEVEQDEEEFEENKIEGGVVEKKSSKSKKKKAKGKSNEKKADIKEIVEEKSNKGRRKDLPKKTAKLVFGEDIRWATFPSHCSLLQLREVIYGKFPCLGSILVKYRDQEGDLVTITSDDELRLAETGSQGSIRLYIVEAAPELDPFYEKLKVRLEDKVGLIYVPENRVVVKSKEIVSSSCIEDWIVRFAKLFKDQVGFESDRYLGFHELGMKLYSEALEEVVTTEEAQDLFDMASNKFQEMTALALFNWGNVHTSRARKKVYFTEDSSKVNLFEQIKSSYEWAQTEYTKAGEKYEEAIITKSDFYEAFLALGQLQFEKAKLSWYYALSSNVDLQTWPSTEVFQLYNNAEENIKEGMLIWESSEGKHLSEASNSEDVQSHSENMELEGILKNITSDEIAAQEVNMRSQINLLWGTMLYERSMVEFKLRLPVWRESLDVAVEKFELAGASPTDISVMLKNHCSNSTAVGGVGFKIDEIVQAWNEMYEAKVWQSGFPSFRLASLFRRRVSKVYQAFELA